MEQEQKRANFKRIATRRTNEIIDKIESLERLNNQSFYSYDEEQIKAIFEAIEKQIKSTKEAFKKEHKRTLNRFKL